MRQRGDGWIIMFLLAVIFVPMAILWPRPEAIEAPPIEEVLGDLVEGEDGELYGISSKARVAWVRDGAAHWLEPQEAYLAEPALGGIVIGSGDGTYYIHEGIASEIAVEGLAVDIRNAGGSTLIWTTNEEGSLRLWVLDSATGSAEPVPG